MEPDRGKKRKAKEKYYTIGEIAKLYHLGVDTIRYYEEKGILKPNRGENGDVYKRQVMKLRDYAEITTIEGIGTVNNLHPIQVA